MRNQDFFRWLPEYKYDAYEWEFKREEKISRYQLGFILMNVFFQNMSRIMGWGKAVTSSKPAVISSMKVDVPIFEN